MLNEFTFTALTASVGQLLSVKEGAVIDICQAIIRQNIYIALGALTRMVAFLVYGRHFTAVWIN